MSQDVVNCSKMYVFGRWYWFTSLEHEESELNSLLCTHVNQQFICEYNFNTQTCMESAWKKIYPNQDFNTQPSLSSVYYQPRESDSAPFGSERM